MPARPFTTKYTDSRDVVKTTHSASFTAAVRRTVGHFLHGDYPPSKRAVIMDGRSLLAVINYNPERNVVKVVSYLEAHEL